MVKSTSDEIGPDDPIFSEGPNIFSAPPRLRAAPPPPSDDQPPLRPPMSPEDLAQRYEMQKLLKAAILGR